MSHGVLKIVVAGLVTGAAGAASAAQPASPIPGLPAKPVVIIVPNSAGGPSDLLDRLVAPKLGEAIRQNVIVDNRASNNGVLAGELASRGAPDGSVLTVGNTGTHAINATLYKRLSYDPVKDFTPKLLGITSSKRDPLLPNVPTFAESGLEGYEVEMWYGFFAPVKTPPAVVQAYYREIAKVAGQPDIREKLTAGGYEVVLSSPEQFGQRVRGDYEKFRKIILDHNMQQD